MIVALESGRKVANGGLLMMRVAILFSFGWPSDG